MGLRKRTILIVIMIGSMFILAFSTPGNYKLTDSANGFTIEMQEIGLRVQGTYLPPGKGNWVAYWLLNDSYVSDLFFMNAKTKQAKRIGFGRTNGGENVYGADFVRPVGFLSESEFIYKSARVVNKKIVYSIRSFDIPSAKETVLFDNVLKNIDFNRGPIWLNKNKDILMTATNTGEVVHYNLKKRTSFVLKKKFPGEWPYDGVSISDTGDYFQSDQDNIYDLNGTLLNKIHTKNPNVKASQTNYRYIDFGINDQYVAHSYTFDGSREHALNPESAMFDWDFATQAIDIERISGELVRRIQVKPGSKRYIQVYSWLSPEVLILHYFNLKPVDNDDPLVINSTYVQYDIRTGKSKSIPVPQPKPFNEKKYLLRKEWEIEVSQDFYQDQKTNKIIRDHAIITYTRIPSKGAK